MDKVSEWYFQARSVLGGWTGLTLLSYSAVIAEGVSPHGVMQHH